MGEDRIARLEKAKNIVVQGQALKYWATHNPLKLETMSENTFEDDLRESMELVYFELVMNKVVDDYSCSSYATDDNKKQIFMKI